MDSALVLGEKAESGLRIGPNPFKTVKFAKTNLIEKTRTKWTLAFRPGGLYWAPVGVKGGRTIFFSGSVGQFRRVFLTGDRLI